MRMVIEIKREASASVVLNTLYKQTNLQVSTGINFLALVRGRPVVLTLKQMLEEYLAHQITVIERRTRFLLNKAIDREHIVKGLIIAIANIDEVVEIIKKSSDKTDAGQRLMEKFLLSEKQVNAILDMRLSSLTNLQVEKLKAEENELQLTIADLTDVLQKPERVREIIKNELTEIKDTYAEERKSEISYDDSDIDIEDLIPREDVVISMTYQGYIKRMALSEYKSQNRGGIGVTAHKTKDEDFVRKMFVCNSHNDVLFFSNTGKAYKLRAYRIPEAASKTSKGRAMINVLPLSEGERITAFLPIPSYDEDGFIIMSTRQGLIRKSDVSEFESVRTSGKVAITLLDGDELIEVEKTDGNDDVIMASHNGKCIRFSEKDVRRTGRGSVGVRSMKLDDDDYIVDMAIIREGEDKKVITISEQGFGKRTEESEFRIQSRAGKGIKAGNFNDKTGKLVNLKLVSPDEDIIIIADNGTMIRVRADQISEIGRNTKGVTIMKLRQGTKVVAMALSPHDDEAEFDDVEVSAEELADAQQESATVDAEE